MQELPKADDGRASFVIGERRLNGVGPAEPSLTIEAPASRQGRGPELILIALG
jgi:hypothetical protein